MKNLLISLTIFLISAFSFVNAKQDSIDIARELCVNALTQPSRENCDAAYLFGKKVLSNANKENEQIKHLKDLLCTSCINCSVKNIDELVNISNEVIDFKLDEIDKAEIHIINAYLIKSMYCILNGDIADANAYINIVSLLARNYKHSKLFDVEMSDRIRNMISLQKIMILKITQSADE